jgi:uncharacterized membrane protein
MRRLGWALALLALAFPTAVGPVLTVAAAVLGFLLAHLTLACIAVAVLLLASLFHRPARPVDPVLSRKLLRQLRRDF